MGSGVGSRRGSGGLSSGDVWASRSVELPNGFTLHPDAVAEVELCLQHACYMRCAFRLCEAVAHHMVQGDIGEVDTREVLITELQEAYVYSLSR